MLERLSEIQGIGLFHDANGKPFGCKKATLVYADNGRGKSTLATVLRSVSTNDPSLIAARKTIDGAQPARVVLQFGSGHKVTYESGAWSEQRPELLVFDADFVARNVHSGGIVNTDHRRNLLEFALGEAAVSARAAVQAATAASKSASDQVNSLVGQLSGHHPGMLLAQFQKLPTVPDLEEQLLDLNKRLSAARDIALIKSRPVPDVIPEPAFDLDAFFEKLSATLQDVHHGAEEKVKQHALKLGQQGAEDWLSAGQQFHSDINCPYCDQQVTGNLLVQAYKDYFNEAYQHLKDDVAKLRPWVDARLPPEFAASVSGRFELAAAQASAWVEQVEAGSVTFAAAEFGSALAELRELLIDLAHRKQASPLEVVGTSDEKSRAHQTWDRAMSRVRETNALVGNANALIEAYKVKLSGEDAAALQGRALHLEATRRRHSPDVVNLFSQLQTARDAVKSADEAKEAARQTLDALMRTTLTKYQTAINALLKTFGASFLISGMSANFRGNAPRTEYGLTLRGKQIPLEGGPPSFETALSEGDKRTLAFAFFVATTLEDGKLQERVVVIDDPMCSLDANRRHQTRTVLRKIYSKSAQLVVLAHDPYFLRDLRDGISRDDKNAQVMTFQLAAAAGGYTDFAGMDLDQECESSYARHHRAVRNFAAGLGGDPPAVAKSIRPLLEGYLHRRFPGLLPEDSLFGQAIICIRDSVPPSPLCYAKNLVDELTEINDYAGQFHHDTNPDADSVKAVAAELQVFANRALDVIHKSAPP